MDLVTQLQQPSSETFIQKAVGRALEAELNEEPMQNGKQRNVDASKNTHFEFEFGGMGQPEVFAYIERYDAEPGIEVLLWADYNWFNDAPCDHGTSPHDGDAPLGEFADYLLELVAANLEADHTPSFEFYQNAKPSVVFSAVFYL